MLFSDSNTPPELKEVGEVYLVQFYSTIYFMITAMFWILMHSRCCAFLLHVRFQLCIDRFESLKRHHFRCRVLTDHQRQQFLNVIQVLEALWKLKLEFQRIFGVVFLMTIVLDLFLIIVVSFLCILSFSYGMAIIWKQMLFTFIAYAFSPYIKCFLMFNSTELFGQDVWAS